MKKIFMFLLFTIVLTGCSYNTDNTYDELVYKYFEVNDYTYNGDTITIKIHNNESNDDLIAKGNLLLGDTLLNDIEFKIKIYKYDSIIPTIIMLEKQFVATDTYIVVGLTINSKEK